MWLGGLWHGAAVNFVLWGLWHGAGLAVNRWWEGKRPAGWALPRWVAWLGTMLFVFFGWMLFRAQSPEQIIGFIQALADWSWPAWWTTYLKNLLLLAAPLVLLQILQARGGELEVVLRWPRWAKGGLQGALLFATAVFWPREAAPFIYFQF